MGLNCSIDKEDIESIQLLKKINTDTLITGRETESNVLDDTEKLKCLRCGFVNSKNSTVCKECNALLKEDVLITEKKQHVYY